MFLVSSPINIKGDFTGRSIINPGYVRQGHSKNQGSGDNNPGEGKQTSEPGLLNDDFYYGFNSSMNQNLRGLIKPKVVMKCDRHARAVAPLQSPFWGGRKAPSQAAGFWRVVAFDRYIGQGCEISRNEQVQTLKRLPCNTKLFLV